MGYNVQIHEKVAKRLSNVKDACTGFLYGISTKSGILVLGIDLNKKFMEHSLPVGLGLCGSFYIGNLENANSRSNHDDDDISKNIIISCASNDGNLDVQVIANGELEKTEYEIVNDENVYTQYMFIRCQGGLTFKCEFTPQSISNSIKHLKYLLFENDDSGIVFGLNKKKTFFLNNGVIGLDIDNSKICDLYKDLYGAGDDYNKRKKSQMPTKPKVLDLCILTRLTHDGNAKLKTQHAPVCILNKSSLTVLDTVANIDFLAMVPKDTEVSDLYPVLMQSVVKYLDLFEDSLKSLDAKAQAVNFETFHFLCEDLSHFFTLLYLENQTDDALKPFRQTLHQHLLLGQSCPRFRRANQYLFEKEMSTIGPLINPHEGIKLTDNGGEIALVKGKYEYYHYCQNHMDDNGWGCAYRSLQTLASWFKLQGYVDKEVPSFHDIQKCLVDIKDKPASFLSSKQWIGSTEVNFVISTLLGIECKILFVSSGDEMASKGPELVYHFKVHGSPIMIGGGVLAHTILGVDYNQSTGKMKFLILDPHYTGGEDLHIIQSKGWCGWKGLDFWDKKAYYNMCLPQVPREV